MREFLSENDLLLSEIKAVSHTDKTIGLHIRHEKFGKLNLGVLVKVSSCLLQRMKTQFYERGNIKIVFGLNGAIWLGSINDEISKENFEEISKLRSLLIILDQAFIKISPTLLFELYIMTAEYEARDLYLPSNKAKIENFVIDAIKAKKQSQNVSTPLN